MPPTDPARAGGGASVPSLDYCTRSVACSAAVVGTPSPTGGEQAVFKVFYQVRQNSNADTNKLNKCIYLMSKQYLRFFIIKKNLFFAVLMKSIFKIMFA